MSRKKHPARASRRRPASPSAEVPASSDSEQVLAGGPSSERSAGPSGTTLDEGLSGGVSADMPTNEAAERPDEAAGTPKENATGAISGRMPEPSASAEPIDPAEKVRSFPHSPGVYLMKDAVGRVLYVGKAKDLRNRAGSYFLKAAAEDPRTASLVREIRDVDYIQTESEVDALLLEARLIKDIQPPYNRELKDDKTFPYLEIFIREDFPRVQFTREPKDRGTKLYGPFGSASGLRGAIQVLQKIFRFRTCTLDIQEGDERWRWYRPCILASIQQCSAPCNMRISKEEYRKDIRRLMRFLEGDKKRLLAEMRKEMQAAAKELRFEEAARLRDEIHALETLDQRGELDTHVQPEVFHVDPRRGLLGLKKVFQLPQPPRTIEGIDIAHLAGTETVASLVQFIDGLPFKPGYKRYRIRTTQGGDDYGAIREVVFRRFHRLQEEGQPWPDLLLIDGGPGQLHAALEAFETLQLEPPVVLALAKREELLYRMGQPEPLRLSRHSFALRLLQYVRDEAHRFAQHYHHILRRKSTLGE
jgi:excinuclease ABC subunit C